MQKETFTIKTANSTGDFCTVDEAIAYMCNLQKNGEEFVLSSSLRDMDDESHSKVRHIENSVLAK